MEFSGSGAGGHVGDPGNEFCDRLANQALAVRAKLPFSKKRLPDEDALPARVEKRQMTLPDGSTQDVEVKVYDPAWAEGASRQQHGRRGNKLQL